MNRSSSSLVTVVFFMIGVLGLNVAVMGQAGSPTAIVPCPDAAPGRPMLKARRPAPDNPATNGGTDDQKPQATEDCQPQSATTQVNEPDLVRIEFAGLHAFEESAVLKTFRKQRLAFPQDRVLEFETINKAAAVLKEMLQSHGYMRAQVDGFKDEASQTVRFVVDEGVRLSIAEIDFAGNRVFSTAELSARMRDCLADHEDRGPGYDRDVLEMCQQRLTSFVRNRGYLQAKLDEPKNQITQQGLVLTIPVEEGVLYRLGDVKIEGADDAAQERLRSRLSLAKGDIANSETLGKWAYEDLKKLYGDLGYIEYTVEIKPEFRTTTDGTNEGVVDLSITIDEGKRFRLGRIEFQGRNLPKKEMRKLFLMNDGDVYSQHLFEAGIKKLNETGWLEIVDQDKDSDFKTDEEQGLVEIVIKVFAKGDPNYF